MATQLPGSDPATSPLRSGAAISATLKLLVLGLLAVGLMIPVGLVFVLIEERSARAVEAEEEIAGIWGGTQTIAGPVLMVPVRRQPVIVPSREDAGPRRETAIFLPRELQVRGSIAPESRRRGLFETVVYSTELSATGGFQRPDPAALGLAEQDLLWERAAVLFTIGDPHGLAATPVLELAGVRGDPQVTTGYTPLPGRAFVAPVPGLAFTAPGTPLPFALKLAVRGSRELRVAPVGSDSTLALESPWPHPGFVGGFLPATHSISPDGFRAEWHVTETARGYASRILVDDDETPGIREAVESSTFGVSLVTPADPYQQTSRAAKYAILIITLTFATFLLCEITAGVRLHPVQYLLVGCALCLFYLLLLALSEQLGFAVSYLVAGAATILLVTGYTRAILESRRLALLLLLSLSVLYGYLFVVLRLIDFALLAGAGGLFTLLALLMWLTRRLDWYGMRFRPSTS